MCGENPSAADERRSLLRESETMARSVRKYVCGIVHMQVSLITVTRDFDDIESDTLASYRELLSIPLQLVVAPPERITDYEHGQHV